MTVQVNEKNAKQGRDGRKILSVLIVSLALAIGVWAIAEGVSGPEDDAEITQTNQ